MRDASHDGNNSYYTLVINRSTSKLELYSVSSGLWGSALASSSTFTISNDTPYVIKAVVKQERIQGYVVNQSSLSYDASTPVDPGQAGMYSDKTNVKFDDFLVYKPEVRDAQTPRTGGLAATSL